MDNDNLNDNDINNNVTNNIDGNTNENVEQNGAFSGVSPEPEMNPNMDRPNMDPSMDPNMNMNQDPNQNMNQGYGYEQPNGFMNNNMNPNQGYYEQPNGYMNNQGYQYPPQGGYQQELEEPVSMGEWLVTMLLIIFVPCVNIILMFVWAFSKKEKKSKSNFFKAQLIITGVILALYIIIFLIFGVSFIAALTTLNT